MPIIAPSLSFADPAAQTWLQSAPDEALDALSFGVIGFDLDGIVCRYNRTESEMAGLSPSRVLRQPMFTVVAPCMNNFMVALRFEEAHAQRRPLDDTIDYVLTLRMKPCKVRLRLLAQPGQDMRHILILRTGS